MGEYLAKYEKQFTRNLKRYSSLRERIKRCVESILEDPYVHTEFLGDVSGRLNLKGCRIRRIDGNFRVIFVICEECRHIPQCEYCFCEHRPDNTIIFLTVGPHDKAYAMK
jgi:mRNA-degrading endonuclease RelE of RelBE toxin-antitoxin system